MINPSEFLFVIFATILIFILLMFMAYKDIRWIEYLFEKLGNRGRYKGRRP